MPIQKPENTWTTVCLENTAKYWKLWQCFCYCHYCYFKFYFFSQPEKLQSRKDWPTLKPQRERLRHLKWSSPIPTSLATGWEMESSSRPQIIFAWVPKGKFTASPSPTCRWRTQAPSPSVWRARRRLPGWWWRVRHFKDLDNDSDNVRRLFSNFTAHKQHSSTTKTTLNHADARCVSSLSRLSRSSRSRPHASQCWHDNRIKWQLRYRYPGSYDKHKIALH